MNFEVDLCDAGRGGQGWDRWTLGVPLRVRWRSLAPTAGAALTLGLSGLLAGCDVGDVTQGSLSVDEVDSPAYSYTRQGPVVAKLRVLAPESPDFILQGTVPVPPGTYSAGDVLVPLGVLSSGDKSLSPSQVEVVSRYPDSSQGADVVEIIAHVRRPNVAPGTPIDYEVVYSPHAPKRFRLKKEIAMLFRAPGALVLRGKDVFGHVYQFDVLEGLRTRTAETVRDGAVIREHKSHGALMPLVPVPGTQATLPHLMGVHSFLRTFDNEDFFALDLHFHNGFDGRDSTTSMDDVLDELHFEQLGIRLPAGWRVIDSLPNPCSGEPIVTGGMQQVALVAPLPNNRLHFMGRNAQFWRRVMIARTPEAAQRALVHITRHNMGFCQEGESNTGAELWSWWNPETARFLPQAHRLPSLAGIDSAENLRAQHAVALDLRLNQVRTGGTTQHPVESPGLGWAHPWGVAYGGMTGGEDITQAIGGDVAWAASPDGYRFYELKARMRVDRQPNVFYSSDGNPLRYENFVRLTGNVNGPYQPQEFSMKAIGNDTFGFAQAPMHQAAAAVAQGRVAPYKQALSGFHPIDLQHYTRYLNNLLVLTWLGNDSLAKEQIEMSGELFHLSHNEAYITAWGNYMPGGGLRIRQQFVAEHPGQGIAYGRGEGWGLYTAAAAFATGDDDLRGRFRPWLRTVAHLVKAGQSTCTGNITSRFVQEFANGTYLTRQSFELAFVVNSLEAIRRSVFEGIDLPTQHTLEEVITAAAYSTIQAPFWDFALGGQIRSLGVGFHNSPQADFCGSLPAAAIFTTIVDNQTPMTAWAYAYEFTRDPIFLQRAVDSLAGTGNLVQELEQSGLFKLPDSSPLLALAQTLSEP